MSLTQDSGRTLPSVFSDIRNNAEVEKARKRIGALGMWIFVLLGIALVCAGLAGGAYYLYQQKTADFAVLQQAHTDLQRQTDDYASLDRSNIETLRRGLLDRLEARGLTQRQQDAGWKAATDLGFRATRGAGRDTNEPSQEWPLLLDQAQRGLRGEAEMVRAADAAAHTAIVLNTPPGTGQGSNCPDPRRPNCGRP